MEYYAAIKNEWTTDTCYNRDEHWKYYAEWKNIDTKCHILHDSIYIKYQE